MELSLHNDISRSMTLHRHVLDKDWSKASTAKLSKESNDVEIIVSEKAAYA